MWTKDFTICLCIAVYQKLALENWPDLSDVVDWSLIFEELKVSVDKSELEALDSELDYIWRNHNQFEQTLNKFLSQPKKTHPFVRAVLLVFLAELLHLHNKSTPATTDQPPDWLALVKKYVRITQNYVGAENPSLVYAVASKLLQENHNQSASE